MEDIQEDNISVGLEQKRHMYIYENQHHMTTSFHFNPAYVTFPIEVLTMLVNGCH